MSIAEQILAVYNPPMIEKIENNILALRTAKGWSQQRLADEVSKDGGSIINKDQVSKHERSDRPLHIGWINRYAKALRCRPTDILKDPPEMEFAKIAQDSDDSDFEPLSNPIGEHDQELSYVDPARLALAIEYVNQAAREQGISLTDAQKATAIANTYSESKKFAEPPSKSIASMAIKLLLRERDNGRELEI